MSGHGHVTPNADGSKARCGGPAICPACAIEAGRLRQSAPPTPDRTCPRCNGSGETGPILACGPGVSRLIDKAPCWVCKGAKTISARQAERMEIGERVREKRLARHIHQAGLAGYLGIDRVDFSKAESLGIGDDRTFDRMVDWLETAP